MHAKDSLSWFEPRKNDFAFAFLMVAVFAVTMVAAVAGTSIIA
jgi:hypothetical protein